MYSGATLSGTLAKWHPPVSGTVPGADAAYGGNSGFSRELSFLAVLGPKEGGCLKYRTLKVQNKDRTLFQTVPTYVLLFAPISDDVTLFLICIGPSLHHSSK